MFSSQDYDFNAEIDHIPLFLRKLRNIELLHHESGRKRLRCDYADDVKSASLTVERSERGAGPTVVQHSYQVYRKVACYVCVFPYF